MARLNLKYVDPPLTSNKITEVENELGVTMPSAYKEFLLQENGGIVPVHTRETKFFIRNFCSIKDDFTDSLQGIFSVIDEMFGQNKHWLPFGFDSGDWIYCLCLKPTQYGQVYLMRTDETLEEEAFAFECNTFEEFLEGLKPPNNVN